jgi:hypothetical protein
VWLPRPQLISVLTVALALGVSATPAHAAIAFRSSNVASTNKSASLTITKPTGVAPGDVLIASVTIGSFATPTTVSSPGWTLIRTTANGSSMIQQTFYKVAGFSEPTSYTFRLASGSNDLSGGIAAYTGVDNTLPVDISADATGASGNAVAPSVTTTVSNERVIAAVGFNAAVTTTPDASVTERFDTGFKTAAASLGDFTHAAAGATAATTAVPSNGTHPWTAQTIALWQAGTLAVRVNANPTFSATLSGPDQDVTYTNTYTVTDTRGTGAGWNIQITSTPFTSGGGATLPADVSAVTGVTSSCDTSCTDPASSVSYPVTIPSGSGPPTAVKIYNAGAGTGMGSFTLTPTTQVTVPGNALAGTYTATRTITIASGP